MSSFTDVLKLKIRGLIASALLAYVIARLRTEAGKCSSIEDLVGLSYSFHLRLWLPPRIRDKFSISPAQVREEITSLLHIVAGLRPRALLEILRLVLLVEAPFPAYGLFRSP